MRETYETARLRVAGCLAAWILCSMLPASAAAARDSDAATTSPQLLFKDLFVAVQNAHLFPDSKTFADAVPTTAPELILDAYHEEHPDSPATLQRFVDAHFTLPAAPGPVAPGPDHESILARIDRLWDPLTRSSASVPAHGSLLALPQPYVVPGGRFRELYYWDSYFTMLGLQSSGRRDLLHGMVQDFAYLIDTYGHVPNGTRTYYLTRSQPPFFFAMAALDAANDPDAALARYLPQLRREYAYWMQGAEGVAAGSARRRVVVLPDGSVLNRYWDDSDLPRDEAYREDTELARSGGRPAAGLYRDIRAAAESGWDFSSRWFADQRSRAAMDTTEIAPVDLNSLLFGLENAIRTGCARAGDQPCAREFAARAASRRRAVDRYLWNADAGAYLDYRWTEKRALSGSSAAALYPLFVGLASPAQAAAAGNRAARELMKSGGLAATTRDTGEQWDAPNGWAPLQWIAISGLRHYGQGGLAALIACRFMANVNGVYVRSGTLVEKYDVLSTGRGGGGEYPLQDGFGWTNGVMRKLLELYPAYAAFTTPAQCATR